MKVIFGNSRVRVYAGHRIKAVSFISIKVQKVSSVVNVWCKLVRCHERIIKLL